MEKTTFEDQPRPDEVPVPTPTDRSQELVNQLSQLMLRRCQLNQGQIDILAMEIKVTLMAEHMQLLTALIVDMSGGKYTDESVSLTMNARVAAVVQSLEESLKTPVGVRGDLRALNGGRKN